MTILKATAPKSNQPGNTYGSGNTIGSGGISIPPGGLTGTTSISTGGSQVYSLSTASSNFTLEGWINLGASGASVAGPSFKVEEESIEVSFTQHEQGNRVRATLNPDTNLSTIELLRLNVLLSAGSQVSHPLSYIRAHSLERHFTFEVV